MLFEKSCKQSQIVSIVCCSLMNEMLKQDNQQAAFLLQKFSQPNALQLLRDLIDSKQTKQGNLSLINGINFGCIYEGYYDPPLNLFQSISKQFFNETKMSADQKQDFLQTIASIKMDEQLMNFLMSLSSKSDMSPLGFNNLLMFIHDSIHHEQKEFM